MQGSHLIHPSVQGLAVIRCICAFGLYFCKAAVRGLDLSTNFLPVFSGMMWWGIDWYWVCESVRNDGCVCEIRIEMALLIFPGFWQKQVRLVLLLIQFFGIQLSSHAKQSCGS